MLTTLRTHPHIDIVNISSYKTVKYVATTKGSQAGGTVRVTRYNPDGTTETRTTSCNSNATAGWPELRVWAWEHWQYQFYTSGTVYIDGQFKQSTEGNFAIYDSGDAATHTHTVEIILKS